MPALSCELLDQILPTDLKSSSVASNGSHFFIFGGTNSSWWAKREVYIIDSQTFTRVENISLLSEPGYNMGTVQIRNRVYLIGGFYAESTEIFTFKRDIYCFDLDTLQFIPVNSKLPIGIEHPETVAVNGIIYIFGGGNIEGLNRQIFKFDPASDTIRVLDALIPARSSVSACWTGSEVLLFGDGSGTEFNDEIWSFDPESGTIETKTERLPAPLAVSGYVVAGDCIYTLNVRNSSGVFCTVYEINMNTLESRLIEENFLNPTMFYFATGRDDFHFYLFGGALDWHNYWGENSIIQLDFTGIDQDTVLEETFAREDWIVSNESHFNFTRDNTLAWNTDDGRQYASREFERTTRTRDCLELEVTYREHSDVNTRQAVNAGWTDSTAITRPDVYHNLPAQNFLGITIQHTFARIMLKTMVIKNSALINETSYSLEPDTTHVIRFQVWILNSTHFLQTVTLDGWVTATDTVPGDVTGIDVTSLAVWNQNISAGELQGNYSGEFLFARYRENVQQPHLPTWYMLSSGEGETGNQGNLLPLFIAVLFILLMGGTGAVLVARKTGMFNYLKARQIDDIPRQLVLSSAYTLYKRLDSAFKRLEMIDGNYLTPDQPSAEGNGYQEAGVAAEWSRKELVNLAGYDFTGLSGTSLDILIYLLGHLDRGTYSAVMETDLNLKRSTLSYNLQLLEQKGLISKKNPSIEADQRMKISVITAEGRGLLYQIYAKLKQFFG